MDSSFARKLWGSTIEGDPSPDTRSTYRPRTSRVRELELERRLRGGDEPFAPDEIIGRGGMGAVFRARQSSLCRDVALKVLLARVEGKGSHQGRAGFLAEALITGRLEHPNIVPVYDLCVGEDRELQLAMKLVGGRSWDKLLETQTLREKLNVLLAVCNGVAFAHSRGVVHCDLKPSNVMIGSFGEVLVMDWGLAVELEAQPGHPLIRHKDELRQPCGTPAYVAPELAEGRGRDLCPQTDIYMLGAILYELLTGRPPHRGANLYRVLANALSGQIPPLPRELPEELRATCNRALSVSIAARHPDVPAFAAELSSYLEHTAALALSAEAERKLGECSAEAHRAERLSRPERNALYGNFAAALAGFEQARKLWEHPGARSGQLRTHLAYAEAALRQGDLGLAEAQLALQESLREGSAPLLEAADEEEQARVQSLQRALLARRTERSAEARSRVRLRRQLGAALLVIVGLVLAVLVQRVLAARDARAAEVAAVADELAPWPEERLAALREEARARIAAARGADLHADPAVDEAARALQKALLGWLGAASRALARAQAAGLELVGTAGLAAHRAQLQDDRGLTARLALAHRDYGLAEQVAYEGEGDRAVREALLAEIAAGREALLFWQLATTERTLDELRAGLAEPDPASPAWTVEEAIRLLSGFRHPDVVALLAERLGPYTARARSDGLDAAWRSGERDEISCILEVLGSLELPALTVPPLAEFMGSIRDHRLAVVCGRALCRTRSAAAVPPLLAAARHGETATWRQIRPYLLRTPMPDTLAALTEPAALLARADNLYHRGEIARAHVDYAALAARGEATELSELQRARCLRQLDRLAEAERVIEGVIAMNADVVGAWMVLGIIHSQRGEFEAALAANERAVTLDPRHSRAYENRGMAYRALGDHDRALADLDTAVQLGATDSDCFVNRAIVTFGMGRYTATIEDASLALEIDPHNHVARSMRGRALIHLGQYDRAFDDFYQAIRDEPRGWVGYADLARSKLIVGEAREALDALDQVLRLEQGIPALFALRAHARMMLGQSEGCAEDFARAVALGIEAAEDWMLYARYSFDQGDLDAAEEAVRSCIALIEAPGAEPRLEQAFYEEALWLLVGIFRARDDLHAALAVLDVLVERAPDLVAYRKRRAYTLLQLYRPEEASAELEILLRVESGDAWMRYMHGAARLYAGDPEGALESFARSLELNPRQSWPRVNGGYACWLAGDLDAAFRHWDPVLRHGGAGLDEVLLSVGLIAASLGDLDPAREYLGASGLDEAARCLFLLGGPDQLGDGRFAALLRGLVRGEVEPGALLVHARSFPFPDQPERFEAETWACIGLWHEQRGALEEARTAYEEACERWNPINFLCLYARDRLAVLGD